MAGELVKEDLPSVASLVESVLGEKKYKDIERMGGLTNHTYKVTLQDDRLYVVRIPGEGTEELIVRSDEKISTVLACDLGIDSKMLYFGEDGSKVTEYIDNAITMSSDSMKESENIKKAAEVFKKLHTSNVDTGVKFEIFDMAAGYEKIIMDNHVAMYDDYQSIKGKVMAIKTVIDQKCDVNKVPCHNDSLCENWIRSGSKMYLIDWEYAGMNDGMWDLADVSIEAGYDSDLDEELLTNYLGYKPKQADWKHFLANKLYVDYLWTLWAKTRVPFDGQPMEDWAIERYTRLKKNLKVYEELKEDK